MICPICWHEDAMVELAPEGFAGWVVERRKMPCYPTPKSEPATEEVACFIDSREEDHAEDQSHSTGVLHG